VYIVKQILTYRQ